MHIVKKFFEEYVRDVTALGGLPFFAIVSLYALFTDQTKFFFRVIYIVIIVMIVTYLIKTLYFRPRPDNIKKSRGNNLIEKADLSSFPSVHAARITGLAVLLSLTYVNLLVTILSMLIVLAVCVSRIMLKRHYALDVVAGFILGLLVGYAAFFWV